MEREDSGIIDLHAIQNRSSNTPPVPTPLSSPPPAFTMEVGEGVDSGEIAFKPKLTKKKKIMIGAGAAFAALFLGIIAFSGGKSEPVKAAAPPAPEPTFTVARATPEPAAPPPSAVTPPKNVPPPPATGNAPSKPVHAARAARGTGTGVKIPPKAGLSKLTKVQSAGTN